MKNEKNFKDKTNQGVGIVNKIVTTLSERPYERHRLKAAKYCVKVC